MILELQDIKKSYGEKEILHGISFKVRSGRAMGFLGRNGAGKSTTIRCLMSVFNQDSGQFLIDGKVFKPGDYRIGYLPEERGMYAKNKVLSQLVYFAMLRGGSKEDSTRSAMEWIRFSVWKILRISRLKRFPRATSRRYRLRRLLLTTPTY